MAAALPGPWRAAASRGGGTGPHGDTRGTLQSQRLQEGGRRPPRVVGDRPRAQAPEDGPGAGATARPRRAEEEPEERRPRERYHGRQIAGVVRPERHRLARRPVVRHPQYTGLMLGILGTLVQWPTLITLLMATILVFTYYRLARREERELGKRFGDEYAAYRTRTPMLLPRLTAVGSGTASGSSDGPGSGGRREA